MFAMFITLIAVITATAALYGRYTAAIDAIRSAKIETSNQLADLRFQLEIAASRRNDANLAMSTVEWAADWATDALENLVHLVLAERTAVAVDASDSIAMRWEMDSIIASVRAAQTARNAVEVSVD